MSAPWTLRGGQVVRFEWFHGPTEAFEAMGLRDYGDVGETEVAAASAIAAWNQLDLEAFMLGWHPDAEWRPAFPEGTQGAGAVFRGHGGIREAWHNARSAWSLYQVEPHEIRPVGESLLVLGRIHARGKASSIEIDSAWSAVLEFRDGAVSSAWDWLDHQSALRAVGLSE